MRKILVAGLAALAAIVSVWSLSNLVSPKMVSKLEATEAATAPMAPQPSGRILARSVLSPTCALPAQRWRRRGLIPPGRVAGAVCARRRSRVRDRPG
jgi:hypothetical protein